jgi:hypothetical protein
MKKLTHDPNRFYVYLHLDLNSVIRYVGKGSMAGNDNRSKSTLRRSAKWFKVFPDGKNFNVKIHTQNLTKVAAIELEAKLIKENAETVVNCLHHVSTPRTYDYDYISSILFYDETSPTCLSWVVKKKHGNVAGSRTAKVGGYYQVNINNSPSLAHRIVWVLHNKSIDPDLFVDHIDRNKLNNKIENLRLVTASENCRNKTTKSNTGYKYITWSENSKRYLFRCSPTGLGKINKMFSIKKYKTKEMALEAALTFRQVHIDNSNIRLELNEK